MALLPTEIFPQIGRSGDSDANGESAKSERFREAFFFSCARLGSAHTTRRSDARHYIPGTIVLVIVILGILLT
jgi:hypothetical protein